MVLVAGARPTKNAIEPAVFRNLPNRSYAGMLLPNVHVKLLEKAQSTRTGTNAPMVQVGGARPVRNVTELVVFRNLPGPHCAENQDARAKRLAKALSTRTDTGAPTVSTAGAPQTKSATVLALSQRGHGPKDAEKEEPNLR